MGQWRLRGVSLITAPMGGSAAFPLCLRALAQPLAGKTSGGARALWEFQAAFPETGTRIVLLVAQGARCRTRGVPGVGMS